VKAWILSVEGDVEAFRFEVGVVEKVPEQSTVLGEAVTAQAANDGFIPPMIARALDAKAVLARRSDLGQKTLVRVCFPVVKPLVGEDMGPIMGNPPIKT
jgi:hypothetical protein